MICNDPLYQCFVDPQLCDLLVEMDFIVDTRFYWEQNGSTAVLKTMQFDEDDYYKQAKENVDQVNNYMGNNKQRIPAYQIVDMEKVLPDFILSKNKGEYEISCGALFNHQVHRGVRIPDLLAATLLKAFDQKKLDPIEASKLLTQIW